MTTLSYEKRPLKKPRIGPPDVYPQEPKQKEDELTSINVKHGFATMPQLTDEFASAKNCNVSASKIGSYFNSILARKEELSTLPDSGRKRQQINPKDNFWPATIRSKNAIEAWFKDLAGNKPLMHLAKKAPNFNKKEDIFIMLCEYQVPMLRASWFIKLSSAYTVAVSEAKIKKRQLPDPTTEWTATLIKFLKDQIPKLQDYYHHSGEKPASGTTPGPIPIPVPTVGTLPAPMHSPAHPAPPSESDYKIAQRQWSYCIQLAKYMYEEGLLERHEYLNWILELLDKMKSQPSDDGILKLFLPLALQYLDEFVQSELLSRRLAYLCAKKLSYMCNSVAETNLNLTSPQSQSQGDFIKSENPPNEKDKKELIPTNPLQMTFNEYLNCPHHRDIILELSCTLQVIGLECPTALVWCGVGENRTTSVWHGSPLDLLQVAPSMLPMPSRVSNTNYRKQLRQSENNIRQRSRQAEGRWCADKWQTSSAGMATSKVLAALDALDRHRFDRVDSNNSLDTLYNKIFIPPGVKEPVTPVSANGTSPAGEGKENRTEYNPSQDESIIQILCEWAVSHERCGEHRAMSVAWLLDKRQSDVTSADSENATADDKDSTSSANNQPGGLPIFQSLLMKFLDNDAPILDDNPSPQNRQMFTNLVHLFAELTRHDVFSHDAYMCTLISRGDLLTGGNGAHSNNSGTGGAPHSNKPATPANQAPSLDDDMFAGIELKPAKLEVPDHSRPMDYDDSKIDDDLDKILQHIKEDQQNSLDAPDSPKDPDSHGHHSHHMISSGMGGAVPMETDHHHHSDHKVRPSRHLLYTTHFPLAQDDSFSQHDCNQRYVLLYGVGKVRDEARHSIKKMSKEICKLFSKKFSIDVAEGGKVKKHSRNEFNFESTTQKCQSLSYFDQHVVTWQCSATVIEMLNSFSSGNSNYLPVQEHVAFLFDLMELALNIYGLIDVCIQILKELPEVEAQLIAKGSVLMRNYTTSLSLYVVGVLRRYHCCLLLNSDQTTAVFEGLCRVVKHVSNPGDCSSAERCILAHLYDLYSSCSLLKSKPHTVEPFGNAYPKIRQALYSALQPNPSNNCVYNTQFMQEMFANPRRGGRIESAWTRQLNESPNNRYSFVINAVVAVCRETDNDRLNDLSVMCAEMTACCNALAGEWLGVLVALCCPISHPNFYMDVLAQVDIQDLTIHNSLAVFTSILIARHCFSLEDFVARIALPSLLKVKSLSEGRNDSAMSAETGMRLTCHLLLRLFKTVECPQPGLYSVSTSPHPLPASQQPYSIRQSCDRHLLAAAHNNINVGPVLAVLKAILVVGDATAKENKSIGKKNDTPTHSSNGGKQVGSAGELSISHILGTSDMLAGGEDPMLDLTVVELEGNNSRIAQRQQTTAPTSEGTASLSAFAWHVLREICSQQWVLERCLSHPEELCHQDNLLDPLLTHSQAQRLLHMICYPEPSCAMDEQDQKSVITMILENLEQWTLRMSWLDLQLMFKQFNTNSSELNQWLDTVAKAAIDVFQLNNSTANDVKNSKVDIKGKSGSIWLVAPLVSKLPSAVQGRVLKVAGHVLESGNWTCKKSQEIREGKGSNKKNVDLENEEQSLLSHQPFLSLILTCLKGQDDQRESLLSSLHSQLSQFLSMSKDERMNNYDDPTSREMLLDALQLRFSLVGGMFDTIQRNTTVTTDWAILLVQLVTYGVIDLNNNSELFTTVIDMLATLVHSTLVSDSQIEKDENKKHYQNLMKKLRKELGDRSNPSAQHVRQLLPMAKVTSEIIACEQIGCLTDTKGNKIAGFDSIDKKQGLQVSDKQRVSTWDLLEGHKNPAPLSWAWFGAVKIERKPLWYEDSHRLLRYHTHNLQRPANYYLDPIPLPPEDLEPIQEKPLKDCELKADTPSSVDQSPRSVGLNKGRVKNPRRPRKPKSASGTVTPANIPQTNIQMPQNPAMAQPQQSNMNMGMQSVQQVPHMVYAQGGGGMPQSQGQQFNPNQGPQQWYPQQQQHQQQQQQQQQQQHQQQQQQQQQQQGYYNQQMANVPRFERPPQVNQSKQALSNLLRQRNPINQFMSTGQTGVGVQPGPQTGPAGYQQTMQRQFPRQPLRQQMPTAMPNNQTMFQQSYSNMQPGMNQSYGGYGGQQMMQGNAQAAMMQAGQPPPMMQATPNQQAMMSGFGGQQQGFVGQQGGPVPGPGPGQAMMAQRGNSAQADYLAAQQRAAAINQANRPQYMQQTPNVTMSTMGPLNGGQGVGVGVPAPPYSRTATGGKPNVQANQQSQQFQQQQRMRLIAMQQQQQQQQQQSAGQGQQQPTPSLVAHLRQMNQQQSQQHNPYQHQPPPYNM